MPVATCPSREELRDYAVGNLSEASADALASHLDACPNCLAELAALPETEDSLITRLREPVPSDPFLEEPGCAQSVAQARAVAESDASATDLPRQLGEYQLTAELGRGGMGTVYKALHTKLGRVVALKVLTRGRAHDRTAVARFEREMQAVGRLEHRHIVRAHDAREIDGTPILVMEHLDGLDLAEIVRRLGAIDPQDACELARQTAVGLQAIRKHGLVHCDIKPSNLMLTVEGEIKILDLGLARLRVESTDFRGGSRDEMTATGQGMGTADYMAPEQASDSRWVDIRADIYSLGCTLYKLLTGRVPFSGPEYCTAFDKMAAHVHVPPPPVGNLAPTVPEGLAAIVARMLAKNPADRFATPAEVVEALAPWSTGADLPALLARGLASPRLPAGEGVGAGSGERGAGSRGTGGEGAEAGSGERGVEAQGVRAVQVSPLPPGEGQGVRAREKGAGSRGAGGEGPLPASGGWKRFVGQVLVLLMVGGLGFALGITIRIKKDGQTTTVEVPEGSNARIAADGSLDVALPEKAAPPPASAAANPADDLKALHGLWKLVRIETGKARTWQLSAKGGEILSTAEGTNVYFEEPREAAPFSKMPRVWFFRPGVWNEWQMGFYYSVGGSAPSKSIDLIHEPAPLGGDVRPDKTDLAGVGIYEIDDHRLKIRLAQPSPPFLSSNPRPKDFSADSGSNDLLLVLERCAPAADEAKIAGRWRTISKTFDGAAASYNPAALHIISANTMDGDIFSDTTGGGNEGAVFALDPTKSPGRIAIYSRNVNWNARGHREAVFGIYKFEGDKLIIAMRQGGAPVTGPGYLARLAANVGPPPEKFESALGSGVTLLVLQRLVLNAAGDSVPGPDNSRGAGVLPAGGAAGTAAPQPPAAPPKVAVLRPVSGILSDYVVTSGSIGLEQAGSAAGHEKILQFRAENPKFSRMSRAGSIEFVYYTYEAEKDVEYRAMIKSGRVATIAENDHVAAPGMTVRVRLKTTADRATLLLPQQAFFYAGGKLSVYVVDERNIAAPRAVEAQSAKSGIVGDLKGVTRDDLVVADASSVKPGMVIRPDFIAGALQSPAAPIEFAVKPLTEIVKYLQDAHHIPIKIDEPALTAAGIKPDVACTMYLHDVSLASALRLLLGSVGLTYVAEDDCLLITVPGHEAKPREGEPSPQDFPVDKSKDDQAERKSAVTAIETTPGNKFFSPGDSITITEVKSTSPDLKAGDKVIVKGHYALSSKPEASLCLFATVTEGSGKGPIRPEQRLAITKGEGDYELSETLEENGYLHVTFYSVPQGKPFGGMYFGTAKQMKEIEHWDVPSWYKGE